MSVWANFADTYLRGMRDRSMRSGTDLAREIQLTDWSTANKRVQPVLWSKKKPRHICTRLGRYLYSTRCIWIINWDIFSPVNASLSVKSISLEELCSCAVSTGSNKGTEIYVNIC